MIHDHISHAEVYYPLSPRFRLGFSYLEQFDPATPDGRFPLDGENVFALVQSYVPTPAAQRPFEAHRAHADLQFVATGEEAIYFSTLDRLTETAPYAAAKDIALYRGDDDIPLIMRPGSFAILYPQDGHKPGCTWRTPTSVKKVVIKIRL